jgi:hypothetical protein
VGHWLMSEGRSSTAGPEVAVVAAPVVCNAAVVTDGARYV